MNICLELINEIEESFTGRECIKSEDRLVTLNIDTEKHDKKPSKSETAAIQKE